MPSLAEVADENGVLLSCNLFLRRYSSHSESGNKGCPSIPLSLMCRFVLCRVSGDRDDPASGALTVTTEPQTQPKLMTST